MLHSAWIGGKNATGKSGCTVYPSMGSMWGSCGKKLENFTIFKLKLLNYDIAFENNKTETVCI